MNIDGFVTALKAVKGARVEKVIGFNAKYAVFVHEILDNKHPVGQAKFLETALRQGKDFLPKAIQHHCKEAKSPQQWLDGVVRAVNDVGEQIIGNAQSLTPVKTGFLVASATTRPAEVK
jgi:hypothetical protein